MKVLFCASILFPFTFWILMHLIPSPTKATYKVIDSKTIARCHELMKSNFKVNPESKSVRK